LFGCIAFTAGMVRAGAGGYVLPFAEPYLNAQGTQSLPYQPAVLAAGAAGWALFTLTAYRKSVKTFEALGL